MQGQELHPVVQEKLKLSGLREMAERSRTAGVFHLATFSASIFLSPFKELHFLVSITFMFFVFINNVIRTIWCSPKILEKYIYSSWEKVFLVLTIFNFSLWCLWMSLQLVVIGLEPSTYFTSLLLVGLCSGGVMGLAPNRFLMDTVILVTLFIPCVLLAYQNTKEGYAMAGTFAFNMLFLLGQSKRVSHHFSDLVINRALSELHRNSVERVLNSVPGLVCVVDYQLNCIWNNQRTNKQILKDASEKLREQVREFIGTNKLTDQFEVEVNFSRNNLWMKVYLSRYIELGEGRVLIIAHDINEIKLAEDELQKQRSLSFENAKLATLGEMSAGIAHEINNPLSVVMARAEMVLDAINKGKVSADHLSSNIQKIIKSSLRIAKIVKGLKAFSRNGEKDPFEKVKVENIIEDVLEFSRERLRHANIELKLEFDSNIIVECRPIQIEQVILNLINNAFDAVVETEKAWIFIEAKREKDQVCLSVMDSGNGIPTPVALKMMQPFFTTKEVGKGTGLGLSISLGIVKAHYGELFYDPKSVHTKFVMVLPLEQAIGAH